MRSFLYPVQFAVRARSEVGAGLLKLSQATTKCRVRLADRQNDGGRDFGVSWLVSAWLALATHVHSRNIFRGCKHPDSRSKQRALEPALHPIRSSGRARIFRASDLLG